MRRHNQRLYRTARSILHHDADAEEAVQDAYLRAFTHQHDHLGRASLSTWLTRIVINEALGRLRRRRTVESLDELTEAATLEAMMGDSFPARRSEGGPEETVARAEMRSIIERAIDELPTAFRVVVVLRAVEQLSTEEAAQILGLPAATVRSRFHRGRQRLRHTLSRQVSSILPEIFAFDGKRCDRIIAAVLARLARRPQPIVKPNQENEP